MSSDLAVSPAPTTRTARSRALGQGAGHEDSVAGDALYALYRRTRIGDTATRYERDKKESNISLFGCNNGFIPWLLRLKVPAIQDEPYCWHVDVLAELNA
jgi:hypothetical protein